jgi:hypothetical protein
MANATEGKTLVAHERYEILAQTSPGPLRYSITRENANLISSHKSIIMPTFTGADAELADASELAENFVQTLSNAPRPHTLAVNSSSFPGTRLIFSIHPWQKRSVVGRVKNDAA